MVEPPAPPPPPEGPPPPSVPPEQPAAGTGVGVKGPDLILLAAGAIFFFATFLPWYRATFAKTLVRVSYSDNAWGSGGLGVLAAILGIGATAVVLSVVFGSRKSMSKQSAAVLSLALAIGGLATTFLRLVFRPRGSAAAEQIGRAVGLEITRGIGLWLAFAAAIVMTVAAYQKYRATAV